MAGGNVTAITEVLNKELSLADLLNQLEKFYSTRLEILKDQHRELNIAQAKESEDAERVNEETKLIEEVITFDTKAELFVNSLRAMLRGELEKKLPDIDFPLQILMKILKLEFTRDAYYCEVEADYDCSVYNIKQAENSAVNEEVLVSEQPVLVSEQPVEVSPSVDG
jgi:hypothetical protein